MSENVLFHSSRNETRQRDYSLLTDDYFVKRRTHYLFWTIVTEKSLSYRRKQQPFEGDNVIKSIIFTLTNLKTISLYSFQLDFLKLVIPTLFKSIYPEWREKSNFILKRNGMMPGTGYDEMFFRAARRMGKTLTLAFFALAVMISVIKHVTRDYKIAVFSATARNSKMFIDECANSWKELPDSITSKFKFERTSEFIRLTKKNNPKDIRMMQSYIGQGPVSIYKTKKSPSFSLVSAKITIMKERI